MIKYKRERVKGEWDDDGGAAKRETDPMKNTKYN